MSWFSRGRFARARRAREAENPQARFQLTLLLFLCSCAVIGILPFSVVRYLQGDVAMAALDAGIVVGMAITALLAWRYNDTRIARPAFALVYTIGAVAAVYIRGEPVLYWLYPVVLANCFVLPLAVSTIFNIATAVAIVPAGLSIENDVEFGGLLMTLFLVNLFAFIFSYRTEDHRRQLQRLATHDPLTGVGNRRLLDEELARAVSRLHRRNVASSLVMFDLDRFKLVNDAYGHDAGDRVLVRLVAIVQARIRDMDRLFRFGGEEFVVLLPDSTLAEARVVAEGLRERIARDLRGPDGGRITASFGCAELGRRETAEAWFSRADAGLYKAKNEGRDRVIVAGPEPVATSPA